jgi:methanogenic corrinoid protein MtbC1
MESKIFGQINRSIIDGKDKEAVRLTIMAINEGLSPRVILEQGLMPSMKTIGEMFSKGEYYMPELMVSGKAMQAAVDQLESFLKKVD